MAARPRRRKVAYRVTQAWSAAEVRALRQHLGMTQEELSRRLGMRQQTVSEWEVGKHRPRGASLTLLNVIAEGAGFAYQTELPSQQSDAALTEGGDHAP
jgi:DNA-binding transcriptional regulator YiaG